MGSQLDKLGLEIDAAIELEDVSKLSELIDRCDELLESEDSKNSSIIFFFKANCYRSTDSIQSNNLDYMWSWQQR